MGFCGKLMLLEIGARTFKAMRAHGTFSVRILPLSKVRAGHCHARFILVYAYTFARLCVYFQKLFSGGAPLARNQALHDFLVSTGGKPSIHDECLYLFEVKKPKKNSKIQSQEGEVTQLNYENYGGAPERAYVGLHVDDAKFTGPDIFIEKFE